MKEEILFLDFGLLCGCFRKLEIVWLFRENIKMFIFYFFNLWYFFRDFYFFLNFMEFFE